MVSKSASMTSACPTTSSVVAQPFVRVTRRALTASVSLAYAMGRPAAMTRRASTMSVCLTKPRIPAEGIFAPRTSSASTTSVYLNQTSAAASSARTALLARMTSVFPLVIPATATALPVATLRFASTASASSLTSSAESTRSVRQMRLASLGSAFQWIRLAGTALHPTFASAARASSRISSAATSCAWVTRSATRALASAPQEQSLM